MLIVWSAEAVKTASGPVSPAVSPVSLRTAPRSSCGNGILWPAAPRLPARKFFFQQVNQGIFKMLVAIAVCAALTRFPFMYTLISLLLTRLHPPLRGRERGAESRNQRSSRTRQDRHAMCWSGTAWFRRDVPVAGVPVSQVRCGTRVSESHRVSGDFCS